jgi:hypothetical protein
LLAHGRWFSPGTPSSSTTKTCCHDIAEILLKVGLNTKDKILALQKNGSIVLGYLSVSIVNLTPTTIDIS